MDVNMTSSKNTSRLSRNINQTKQRLRRRLINLSKDVREIKETTGIEASILIATKDKKLYCVKGQQRFQDMRARVAEMNIFGNRTDDSEGEALYQGVDEEERQCRFNRPIATMGQDELEQFQMSLLKLKKDVEETMAEKSGGADGSYYPPARPSWDSSLPTVPRNATFVDSSTTTAAHDEGDSIADRDGSATVSVSCDCGSGVGRSRMKRSCL